VLVPPGVEHTTGALGWSLAVFVAPGSRGTPYTQGATPIHLGGAAARRIVDCCRHFDVGDRAATAAFVEELARLALPRASSSQRCDLRVERAMAALASNPDTRLPSLAKQVGLSLDRLSRLTRQHTGTNLRRLVLWNRLLAFLATNHGATNIAAGAAAAGFADHAHLTRTFRACLGRVPSDFRVPPDTIEPW
jgi:AraC-like DNA-binding protein